MKSVGKLRYSPKLNGSHQRRDGGSTKWWLVIDVDPEIGRYAREMYRLWKYKTDTLNKPLWEVHISVIRDEEPHDRLKYIWEKYNGDQIEFEYQMIGADGNDTYVWLPVVCPQALDIREELGLPRDPYFPLHMTIGNRKTQ